MGLRWAALPCWQRGFGEPPGTVTARCPSLTPRGQWGTRLASARLPWAAHIKGARAGWRALARRALPCPHPATHGLPAGPSAALAAGWAAGQG